MADDVWHLAETSRAAFTGGWQRQLARLCGVFNPDLAVLNLKQVPVATNVTLAFHAGGQIAGPEGVEAAGRVGHDLALGIGQMVRALGAAEGEHVPPGAAMVAEWTWADGESLECYAQAFAGEVPARFDPLMLVLQGAGATAALVANSTCCPDCHLACFKHRLVVAHHIARSLKKLRDSASLGADADARVGSLLGQPDVREVLHLRALRNGLVHLGLSDVPAEVFSSETPIKAVISHYAAGRSYEEVDALVRQAMWQLHDQLAGWLVEPPRGGVGFARLLRAPAD